MTDMERILVVWTGQTGLPGVSVFYGASGALANASVKAFFNSVKGAFASSLTWTIPGSGDVIEDTDGSLVGSWSNAGGGGTVTGSSAGAFGAGCGLYVKWNTGQIVGSRRLQGRTFMTNILSSIYDSSGTIDNSNLATFQTAADTLAATNDIKVWHRPTPGNANGISHPVATALVPDQVTSLRTRRR